MTDSLEGYSPSSAGSRQVHHGGLEQWSKPARFWAARGQPRDSIKENTDGTSDPARDPPSHTQKLALKSSI